MNVQPVMVDVTTYAQTNLVLISAHVSLVSTSVTKPQRLVQVLNSGMEPVIITYGTTYQDQKAPIHGAPVTARAKALLSLQ